MQISNPLHMNDWEIKKLLRTVLSVQAVVWFLALLNAWGIQTPIVQPLFTLFYLLFVPGVLILRVLDLHQLGDVTSLLYAVGLSIANVMAVGLAMNALLPAVGFLTPISMVPLLITFGLETCILCAMCYKFDKYVPKTESYDISKELLSPKFMLLCLIPFLSIFSTQLMNAANNPSLQLLLIVIIAALTIFIGFRNSFPEQLYPFSIFVIALSLVYATTLISRFLTGSGDVYQEYYVANLVIQKSVWDSTLNFEMGASAAVTMLAPILSIFSGVSLTYLFKAVYPFLFALTPVCLYQIFKKLTNPKIAFFSVILFVFSFPFYVNLMALERQQISELFLALFMFTIVYARTPQSSKAVLLIFAISTIVAHYALAFLWIFVLINILLVVSLSEVAPFQERTKRVLGKLPSQRLRQHFLTSKYESNGKSVVSLPLVLLFTVGTMAWLIYASRSIIFETVVKSVNLMVLRLQTEFLAPQSSEGLQVLIQEPLNALHQVAKDIRLIQQALIFIGAAALTLRFVTLKFTKEYLGLIWMLIAYLVASVIIPSFASQLYVLRLYHIILMFTAPCCVVGILAVLKGLGYVKKMPETRYLNTLPKILAVFFAVFLLFETGFVYKVVDQQGWSIAIGSTFDSWTYNSQEENGAQWMHQVRATNYLFADPIRFGVLGQFGWGTVQWGQPIGEPLRSFSMGTLHGVNDWTGVDVSRIPKDSMIFLGTYNILQNKIAVKTIGGSNQYIAPNSLIDNRGRIFDNGGARVYYG